MDQSTGIVSTALGEPLSGKDIKTRLKKLSDLQKVRCGGVLNGMGAVCCLARSRCVW